MIMKVIEIKNLQKIYNESEIRFMLYEGLIFLLKKVNLQLLPVPPDAEKPPC